MAKGHKQTNLQGLPACAAEFIKLVIKKMRYRKKVRRDVQAELAAHFEDDLKDCKTDEQREQKARELVGSFGDVKLLAILLRRAKKRCRPLWRKVLVRGFQVVGVVILYILICSAPLFVGRPNVSVNYVDWLNDKAKAGRDESENAYPYYERAVAACVKMPDVLIKSKVKWPTDFNDIEMQQLLLWINDNNKALELMIEGAKRPHYWAVHSSAEADFFKGAVIDDALMENLSGYRVVARALNWRSRYKAYEENVESALEDCVSLVKFGRHQQGKGLLIEQLVGIAVEALAHGSISLIIEKTEVPADTLKNIQEKLQDEFADPQNVFNLDGEKVFTYDYIQRSFTDDGKGGGRMLARGAALAVGDWKSGLWRFVTLSYPDRREVTAKVDQYYQLAEQVFDETPWRTHQEDESEKYMEIAGDSFLLKITAPAHGRAGEIGWRMKTMRLGLLTMLALARYEKEKGEYPENLRTLVEAGYLKEMPNDPYSDGSLVYKKTDESFILYSFGENLSDDEGQVARRDDGRIQQWASEGDWVFWPEPESQITQ
ncbi:MAG TPA: hypothetical protein HPP66_00320 [Planctomycetes bacterium]|nr:hypothetical protein [Planctomycetota bacterium]